MGSWYLATVVPSGMNVSTARNILARRESRGQFCKLSTPVLNPYSLASLRDSAGRIYHTTRLASLYRSQPVSPCHASSLDRSNRSIQTLESFHITPPHRPYPQPSSVSPLKVLFIFPRHTAGCFSCLISRPENFEIYSIVQRKFWLV